MNFNDDKAKLAQHEFRVFLSSQLCLNLKQTKNFAREERVLKASMEQSK